MKQASSRAQKRFRIWLIAGACAALSACGAQPPEPIDEPIASVEDVERLEQVVDTSLPLVQQAYSIESEKVTEIFSLIEIELWLSVGEVEETVGAVVSIMKELAVRASL